MIHPTILESRLMILWDTLSYSKTEMSSGAEKLPHREHGHRESAILSSPMHVHGEEDAELWSAEE